MLKQHQCDLVNLTKQREELVSCETQLELKLKGEIQLYSYYFNRLFLLLDLGMTVNRQQLSSTYQISYLFGVIGSLEKDCCW